MKGNPKVLQFLNTVLRNELTAINQYFLHAKQLEHWGVTKLGKYERDESITEMKHADRRDRADTVSSRVCPIYRTWTGC